MKKEFLGANSRFKTPPSDNLINGAFAYELEASKYLYKGLSFADIAHVATLRKGEVISEEIYRSLMTKLVEFHHHELLPVRLSRQSAGDSAGAGRECGRTGCDSSRRRGAFAGLAAGDSRR